MLKKITRLIRDSNIYDKIVRTELYRTSLNLSDTIAGAVAKLSTKSSGQDGHILLAPTGGGNIGDQALFESYLENVNGKVTVLVSSVEALIVPENDKSRVTLRSSFGYTYAPPVLRIPSAIKIARLVRRSSSVSVIGADLMDGLYNVAASLSRTNFLWLGAKFGKPSILVGCSWAEGAERSCALNLQRASRAGAVINARDTISRERMTVDGIKNTLLVADLVFSLSNGKVATPADEFIAGQQEAGQKIALVNMSGLVGNKMDQIPEYVLIVDHLLENGYAVLLLPHVFRSTGDDLAACRELLRNYSDSRISIVGEPLRPHQIRELTKQADQVVTGRMHLAVMSLSEKKIPITLGTHGKVEGMYRHFGNLDYCVVPKAGFGGEVINHLQEIDHNAIEWSSRLKHVETLAQENLKTIRSLIVQ